MTGQVIRFLRDVRLVPILLVAISSLFALKTLGLVLDGGYLFDNPAAQAAANDRDITGTIAAPARVQAAAGEGPAAEKRSWAQQMFNYPDITGAVDAPAGSPNIAPSPPDIAPAPSKQEAAAKKKLQEPPPMMDGVPVPLDNDHPLSPAERAILESLQKRRAELEARDRELDMREDIVKAAEKRLEERVMELKELEAKVDAEMQKKDDAAAAGFKNVITMYENMRPKDAAKIFDGLDIRVLLGVAREINPRRMSDILAQMQPETAQRLTTELAARPGVKEAEQATDLPKIEGSPSPN